MGVRTLPQHAADFQKSFLYDNNNRSIRLRLKGTLGRQREAYILSSRPSSVFLPPTPKKTQSFFFLSELRRSDDFFVGVRNGDIVVLCIPGLAGWSSADMDLCRITGSSWIAT